MQGETYRFRLMTAVSWAQPAILSRNSQMSKNMTLINAVTRNLPAIRLYVSSTSMLTVGIAAQSIGFIVLARCLGSDQFGHLSMIAAATNLGAACADSGPTRRCDGAPVASRPSFPRCLVIA